MARAKKVNVLQALDTAPREILPAGARNTEDFQRLSVEIPDDGIPYRWAAAQVELLRWREVGSGHLWFEVHTSKDGVTWEAYGGGMEPRDATKMTRQKWGGHSARFDLPLVPGTLVACACYVDETPITARLWIQVSEAEEELDLDEHPLPGRLR